MLSNYFSETQFIPEPRLRGIFANEIVMEHFYSLSDFNPLLEAKKHIRCSSFYLLPCKSCKIKSSFCSFRWYTCILIVYKNQLDKNKIHRLILESFREEDSSSLRAAIKSECIAFLDFFDKAILLA
jgi:hypothetical protein